MRVKKIRLKDFKRFDDLTINLGDSPKKVIALVGPNGCGKSSVFDAFEVLMKQHRYIGNMLPTYYQKSTFKDRPLPTPVNYAQNIELSATKAHTNHRSFYIRSAYRYTPHINIHQIEAMSEIINTRDEPVNSVTLDGRLVNNYRRLLGMSYNEFSTGNKTGNQVRQELIGNINVILERILDVKISNLGNVLEQRGQLYFEKENTKDFPYENLSAGEKEVVDLIIDFIVKRDVYDDTVYCIDEPELHLNTSVQRKLLVELNNLIPDTCQLWVATHSIGFLRALQEELRDNAQILDFSEHDYFNGTKTIVPIKHTRKNWQRIFSTALEDLTGLIAPNRIIYTEGKVGVTHTEEKGLDAKVYNQIFEEQYHDTLFVSAGGNTELDQRAEIGFAILGKVFTEIEIWVLKDRDFDSGKHVDAEKRKQYLDLNDAYKRVLNRWEIENYLFDKEILKKYCEANSFTFNEGKYDGRITDIINQNVKDEISFIKACCSISHTINTEMFKLELAKHITSDTQIYKELVECIFERK